jgi:hypothetical protein
MVSVLTHFPVGASVLAKAVWPPVLISTDPPPSLASQLAQGFVMSPDFVSTLENCRS